MSAVADTTLPAGVVVRPLEAHGDERGTFTELYRLEWETGVAPIQWNAVGPMPVCSAASMFISATTTI